VVPPVGFAIRVMLWPESIDGLAGVTAPATSAELTVTVSPGEQRDSGDVAESVTLYEKLVVEVGELVYVVDVAPVMRFAHAWPVYH
jgi:hypothetical protein